MATFALVCWRSWSGGGQPPCCKDLQAAPWKDPYGEEMASQVSKPPSAGLPKPSGNSNLSQRLTATQLENQSQNIPTEPLPNF